MMRSLLLLVAVVCGGAAAATRGGWLLRRMPLRGGGDAAAAAAVDALHRRDGPSSLPCYVDLVPDMCRIRTDQSYAFICGALVNNGLIFGNPASSGGGGGGSGDAAADGDSEPSRAADPVNSVRSCSALHSHF